MNCVPQIFVIPAILMANIVFSLPQIHSFNIDRIYLLENMSYMRCCNNMIANNEGEYICTLQKFSMYMLLIKQLNAIQLSFTFMQFT